MSNNPAFGYIKSLDGVRAFALILVLVFHGSYGKLKGGWVGVDLFFVLSGYLISTLLLHEYSKFKKIILKKFYIRRVLRLIPPLIICIILANVLWKYSSFYTNTNQYVASLASVFYMANLLGNYMGNLGHVWSLSVEEHFYLIWPVFASFYLFKKSFSTKILVIALIIICSSALRIYLFHLPKPPQIGPFTIDYYSFTLSRVDGILYGVIMAIVLFEKKLSFKTNLTYLANIFGLIILILFVGISLFLDISNSTLNNAGFILINLLCTSAVLFAVTFNENILLSNKIMSWLGQRSYGIYVYHLPIFLALERFRHQGSTSNFLLVMLLRFVFTFVMAELSYRFAEKPILKLKRHFIS